MKHTIATILLMLLTATTGLLAQQSPAAPVQTTTVSGEAPLPAPAPPRTSQQVREAFISLLGENPPELGTILSLDPTLLSNEGFLSGYPALNTFVTQNPEVRRNPRFYLSGFELEQGRDRFAEDALQGVVIVLSFLVATFTLGWLVRTIIEQRRWNRLSRTQSEVHNKILDRFGATDELLAYIKSPAGSRFLESAPIPLHADRTIRNSPVSRILWSVQVGIIVVAGALGAIFVSGNFAPVAARTINAIGMITLALGTGFILSAIVSMVLSRPLGLSRNIDDEATTVDRSSL
ncbi:MAG: hypothetical protein ABI718_10365 [Acidobacteriota bacterium]